MIFIFGLVLLGIGILLVIKCVNLLVMVLLILVGMLFGEICNMEKGINMLVSKFQQLMLVKGKKKVLVYEFYIQSYVVIIVLFCVSGIGVFGVMCEGMIGDVSILIVKVFFDFFIVIIFVCILGIVVVVISVLMLFIQLIFVVCVVIIMLFIMLMMLVDFSVVGGMLLVVIGLCICGIKMFVVVNMLFVLVLVMLIFVVWMLFFV